MVEIYSYLVIHYTIIIDYCGFSNINLGVFYWVIWTKHYREENDSLALKWDKSRKNISKGIRQTEIE